MVIFLGRDKIDSEAFKNLAIKEYERLFKINLGEFSYTKEHKPTLKNAYISISHTENIILVAISDREIGIDIENKERKINLNISIKEWTEFEAYAKWTGKGINREVLKSSLNKNLLTTLDIDERYYISIFSEDKNICIVCI